MGCKVISSNSEKINNAKKKEKVYDYRYFKEEKKQQGSKFYECKIKVSEVSNSPGSGNESRLISKYFFFEQNGDLITKIKNLQTQEITTITGSISKTGFLQFSTKDEKSNVYSCEAQIPFDKIRPNDPLTFQGKVFLNKNLLPDKSVIIEFPKCVWSLHYEIKEKPKNLVVFMLLKNNVFNGISFEPDEGVSFWIGFEKDNKNDKLIQRYLSDPDKCFVYQGTNDKISGHKIEGSLTNDALGINGKFNMKISYKKQSKKFLDI